MRFTEEEIEDLTIALESYASRKNANAVLWFDLKEPHEEEGYRTINYGIKSPYYGSGFSPEYQPFVLTQSFINREGKKSLHSALEGWYMVETIISQVYLSAFLRTDSDEPVTFTTKEDLFKFLDVGSMITLATKVPKPLAENFRVMCNRIETSVSEHLRDLLRADMEKYMKEQARRMMFKDVS